MREHPAARSFGAYSLLWIGLVLPAALCGQAAAPPAPTNINLATFDAAWRIVAETHFDPDFNGVDWDAVREELRPVAAAASDAAELREVLNDMVARLGQSHFSFISGGDWSDSTRGPSQDLPVGCSPASQARLSRRLERGAFGDATPGLVFRYLDGEVLVERVLQGSPASARKIRPGWKVIEAAGEDVQQSLPCFDQFESDTLKRQLLRSWLDILVAGAPGTLGDYVFETQRGRLKRLTLERLEPEGEIASFGNLPATRVRFGVDWVEVGATRVAVVDFNIWLLPIALSFEEALPELRKADALVFDLRGNYGGLAAVAQGLAGHLFEQRTSLGTLKSRDSSLELAVLPRKVTRSGERVHPFSGPIAVLVDGFSASTSEVFAAGLRDHDRARLFGQPTMGAALPALMERLPNGDVFLHATSDYIRPNGQRVEGHPIQPDHLVVTTRQDLLEARDPPLDAALAWLETASPNPPTTLPEEK